MGCRLLPRVTQCKYKRIGCPWHGPFHELTVHEAACAHPTKTGNELMEILDEMDQSHRKEMQLYNSIFSLLSFEKIGYTGEVPCDPLHATLARGGPGSWEPGPGVDSGQQAQVAPDGQASDKLRPMGGHLRGEDGPEAERGWGQDPADTCMALTRFPPTCPPPSRPCCPSKATSLQPGAVQPWDGGAGVGSNQKVGVWGSGSWGPALRSQGHEEHSSHRVLPAGGYCSGHGLPEASEKMVRARVPDSDCRAGS